MNKINSWSNEKQSLEEVIKQIEKTYGKGAVMLFTQSENLTIDVADSGSILLNQATGIGGFPKGRITEIFGPESTGKTTIALVSIAAAQAKSQAKKTAIIDVEHALDLNYCQKLQINLDELILSQPDSGEQALDILEIFLKSQLFDLIVVDSVAALIPLAELNGDINDQVMGAQARLMSKGLRRIAPITAKSNCAVIFINQIREKIGIVFGNPETTPGGKALRFYSSLRLDVRKGEQIITNLGLVGHKIKIKVVKNKLAIPYRTAILDFYFDYGISQINEIIDLAIEQNILKKTGSWLSYEQTNLAQGKEKTKEFLENHSDILEKIKELVKI